MVPSLQLSISRPPSTPCIDLIHRKARRPLRRPRRGASACGPDFDYARYAFSLLQVLNPSWLRISVVVPNYNYQRYLAERMESIFAQTVPVFEIIVLDDASDDDSVAVLERLRKTA